MSPLVAVLAAIAAAGAVALGVVLLRFNRKRVVVARSAAAASDEQLERIYTLVEAVGSATSNGCVLARTNRRSDQVRALIPIPAGLDGMPWAGRVVEVHAADAIRFDFVDANTGPEAPCLAGRVYRSVRVPRRVSKDPTRSRNVFAPEALLARNAPLTDALASVCPAHSEALLAYLLCAGRDSFEFDPVDQARIGTRAAWLQGRAEPRCASCREPMQLIVQLPGALLGARRAGTHYFFGCAAHADQLESVTQYD